MLSAKGGDSNDFNRGSQTSIVTPGSFTYQESPIGRGKTVANKDLKSTIVNSIPPEQKRVNHSNTMISTLPLTR